MVTRLLLGLTLLLFPMVSNCQDLSIHLDTRESAETIQMRSGDQRCKLNVPYLIVKYKNLGTKNIFFKKIVKDDDFISFPDKEDIVIIAHTIELLKRKQDIGINIYSPKPTTNFFIDISNVDQQYLIKNNELISLAESLINSFERSDSLLYFYNQIALLKVIFESQNNLTKTDSTKQFVFFNYPNKKVIPFTEIIDLETPKKGAILTVPKLGNIIPVEKFEDHFVLLKPNEEYEQRINILALKITGGTYHFSLEKHRFDNYLSIYDSGLPGFKKIKLPIQYKDYNLYTGGFISDSVGVTFGNQPGYFILGKIIPPEDSKKRKIHRRAKKLMKAIN